MASAQPDLEATRAYLFQHADGKRLAVTRDASGGNLPEHGEHSVWTRNAEFELGVHHPVPVPIDPEPILRGLEARGYFVWKKIRMGAFGTAQ